MKEYLGDSIYVEADGQDVIITTENSYENDPRNRIVFNTEMLDAFTKWVEHREEPEAPSEEIEPTKKILTDTDPMPFGKHKGVLMQDVPASYMFWLWTGGPAKEHDMVCPVADYIRRNKEALEKDYPDGIW